MPKVFVAGFIHETNTFLESKTTLDHFKGKSGLGMILRGQEIFRSEIGQYPIKGMVKEFTANNWDIVPGIWATTEPGGIVTSEAFETITTEILSTLKQAGSIDAVCLDMHGAMVVEGIEDAEGELIARIRNQIGNSIPIVGALDLHGNISAYSVEQASALVSYRCYPHTDMFITGERVARLAIKAYKNKKEFHKKHLKLPFLMPIYRQTTLSEPCKGIYQELERLEKADGIESLSFLPGFPLADISDMGPVIVGFGNNVSAVDSAVYSLYDFILKREGDFKVDLYSAAEGVARAIELAAEKQVLIADVQDNAGGGGTSDTTWILEELVKQNAPSTILGLMFDPESAEKAHEAGIGASISLSLGGKNMKGHSPFEGEFIVENLREAPVVLTGSMSKGMKVDLGKVALLKIKDIRVVVTSVRTQCHDTEYFRQVGLRPENFSIIVVKSAGHYRADFCTLVSELIEIGADGACRMDPSKIEYKNLQKGMRLYGMGPKYQ